MERAGLICNLTRQTHWPLIVNGVAVGEYTDDFNYTSLETGEFVVEDVKGYRTRDYALRKALLWALHGVRVREV